MKQILSIVFGSCWVALCATPGTAAEPYHYGGGDSGACNVAGAASYGGVRSVGYDAYDRDDGPERFSSGFERWWLNFSDCIRRRRLRGYKRTHSDHHKFLYPQSPPYCTPTFGYHHTQWRPFPEAYEYSWTTPQSQPVWPQPMQEPALLPLTPTPQTAPGAVPAPAPAVETPYFPESAPLIQPSNEAPPAPPVEPSFEAPLPEVEAFLPPERTSVESASYDLPVLIQINQ